MRSNPFSSRASSRIVPWYDPTVSVMPIFLGVLRAAPFAPFFAMFFGPHFDLSAGLESPNVWGLALIATLAFWCARLLPKVVRNPVAVNVLYMLIGVVGWVLWLGLDPNWPIADVLRDPLSIITHNGHFAWVFVVSMVFYLFTLRLALDDRERSSDGVRGIMARSLGGILVGTLLAAVIGNELGDAGIQASFQALPAALISGIGALGLSEMGETRAAARRRGTTVPGWTRWLRTFGGTSTVVLIVVFVAALVFGPGFVRLVLEGLAATWHGISTVILWVMYGVVYVLVYLWKGIAWILNHFFDTNLQPQTPEQLMGMQQEATPEALLVVEESSDFPINELLRAIGIGAVMLVGLALAFRFVRYREQDDDGEAREERESVFSGSLLRNQIRGLFGRRGGAEKPRKINLADDPATVREAMLFLQVLAQRLAVPRSVSETPHDFTARLADAWPQVADPLLELNRRYERVRYGETDEDRAAAVTAWRQIWRDREPAVVEATRRR